MLRIDIPTWRLLALGLAAALPPQAAHAQAQPADKAPHFERDVLPLLTARCLECHGAAKHRGGLDLRSKATMLQGGDSGPALVPGSAEKSPLYQKVHDGEMPPKKERRLSAREVALLKAWIDSGAPAADLGPARVEAAEQRVTDRDRAHWSFRKLRRPEVPRVRGAGPVRTPIDAFVLARLEVKGLRLAPEADRATLLRRACLDLVGLPPSPEELRAFLADRAPDAYERLLDRLLASPHFGERWGRHWLDEAGFVDVTGVDNDAGTIKLGQSRWRYRDYVIRSFNQDKPLDRFLTEQLAGDELVDWRSAKTFTPETLELLIATGFLRTAADDTDEQELNKADMRHSILQHTVETVAGNLLGLTVGCAKCHDHKYEPIRQRDYYRLNAVFQGVFDPAHWLTPSQRDLPDVPPAEHEARQRHNAAIDAQIAPLQKELEERRKQKDAPKDRQQALERRIAELNGQRQHWGLLQVAYDVGTPSPTHVLRRGNHLAPGAEVSPGLPSVLCPSEQAATLTPGSAAGQSCGRRLAFARALTHAQTPAGGLVLRVRVNRLWQRLFGRGLVETADNFGRSGRPPTHPALLEWLAAELAGNGQHVKPLLKLIMTSSVYRQASKVTGAADAARIDPDNQLLWRMPLRRVDSEVVRDSLLAVSGKLDRSMGGPAIPVASRADGMFVVAESGLPTPTSRWRRSVYLLGRRNYPPTFLGVFDQPVLTTNCTRRTPSAVVLQSLTMLNDTFVVEQAKYLAERVAREAGTGEAGRRVEVAFRLVLGRDPSPKEKAWSAELLAHHIHDYQGQKMSADEARQIALVHLCHMLVNTSEYLYTP
jgi:hypothetical protein